jgi:hypothetical protein
MLKVLSVLNNINLGVFILCLAYIVYGKYTAAPRWIVYTTLWSLALLIFLPQILLCMLGH